MRKYRISFRKGDKDKESEDINYKTIKIEKERKMKNDRKSRRDLDLSYGKSITPSYYSVLPIHATLREVLLGLQYSNV